MTDKEELAALKKKVEELEAKVSPPKSTFVPMTDAEWRDKMHQMRERQANSWMPPSAVQEMVAAEPKGFMHDVALRDARAPQSAAMIPEQPTRVGGRSDVRGTGWVNATPIGPSPHQRYVDAQIDAQDAKDRAALIEQEARRRLLGK